MVGQTHVLDLSDGDGAGVLPRVALSAGGL
jgi:hypothetical protein